MESWKLKCDAKKDKQKTLSQPTFVSFKVNKLYKFHSGLFKVLAEETVYDHAKFRVRGKKIKFMTNF